jgi:hypothetical protein
VLIQINLSSLIDFGIFQLPFNSDNFQISTSSINVLLSEKEIQAFFSSTSNSLLIRNETGFPIEIFSGFTFVLISDHKFLEMEQIDPSYKILIRYNFQTYEFNLMTLERPIEFSNCIFLFKKNNSLFIYSTISIFNKTSLTYELQFDEKSLNADYPLHFIYPNSKTNLSCSYFPVLSINGMIINSSEFTLNNHQYKIIQKSHFRGTNTQFIIASQFLLLSSFPTSITCMTSSGQTLFIFLNSSISIQTSEKYYINSIELIFNFFDEQIFDSFKIIPMKSSLAMTFKIIPLFFIHNLTNLNFTFLLDFKSIFIQQFDFYFCQEAPKVIEIGITDIFVKIDSTVTTIPKLSYSFKPILYQNSLEVEPLFFLINNTFSHFQILFSNHNQIHIQAKSKIPIYFAFPFHVICSEDTSFEELNFSSNCLISFPNINKLSKIQSMESNLSISDAYFVKIPFQNQTQIDFSISQGQKIFKVRRKSISFLSLVFEPFFVIQGGTQIEINFQKF